MCSFVGVEKWKKNNGGAATKFAVTKVKKTLKFTQGDVLDSFLCLADVHERYERP